MQNSQRSDRNRPPPLPLTHQQLQLEPPGNKDEKQRQLPPPDHPTGSGTLPCFLSRLPKAHSIMRVASPGPHASQAHCCTSPCPALCTPSPPPRASLPWETVRGLVCKQQNMKSNNLSQKGNFLEGYQSSRTRGEAENFYFMCLLLSGHLVAERLQEAFPVNDA